MALRDKKRIQSMRRVQSVALDLFERRGFEGVTIEEIASVAEVGPATVYRHFGSKERIVLWDEYDPQLFAAISARLGAAPPVHAVREALVASLDQVYADDATRILRRARLMGEAPALRAASFADMASMRQGLARLFDDAGACVDPLDADVAAGAIVATLEAAIQHWVADSGRTALRRIIGLAFRRLERLSRPPAGSRRRPR
jgi:AcrR family transcriptional regulator